MQTKPFRQPRRPCSEAFGLIRFLKAVGLAMLSALIVTGCVQLGPDYERPEVSVETDWVEIDKQYVSTESPWARDGGSRLSMTPS